MAIVVDEIVISVEVGEASGGAGNAGDTAPRSGPEREALVSECVERVLEVLAQKEER